MLHHHTDTPSRWIERWADLIAQGGRVLDVASGSGRHARLLAAQGHDVDAVDRDVQMMATLAGTRGVTTHCVDLEHAAWPFGHAVYAGVVVANYLHRPLFPDLLAVLAPGGVLIYETFAAGNERYGRPSNPAFLLRPGELLDIVRGKLRVIAYEDVKIMIPSPLPPLPEGEGKSTRADAPITLEQPKPALVQRIVAMR